MSGLADPANGARRRRGLFDLVEASILLNWAALLCLLIVYVVSSVLPWLVVATLRLWAGAA
jgi:hypothetical protein